MRHRAAPFFVASFVAFGVIDAQQPASWAIDPKPVLVIGDTDVDTSAIFGTVVGATRLPNGNILVGDRGAFSLKLFAANGQHLRGIARKGSGPGEINYLRFLLRCGDSLFTMDIENGHRVDVRTLEGTYTRTYRFKSPQGGNVPYATVCNRNRVFAHYGWENVREPKSGVYRQPVPFWLSGPDSTVRRIIGTFDGSERFGMVARGRAGSRPLPLGKEPVIAIGRDRVYIGTADRYEIMVFDLAGNRVTTITRPNVDLQTTKEDIEYDKEKQIAGRGDSIRKRVELSYASMPLPKTIPAYARFVVDADDYLWVQDYPRAQAATVRWSVFDRAGNAVTDVALPTHLEVYEVGRDYVLGRYVDPDEQIPQVRVYRLTRR